MIKLLKLYQDKFNKDYPKGVTDYECHNWQYINKGHGYGEFQFRHEGKKHIYAAHRVSFMLNAGISLTTNDVIMHTCDNPKCVNPRHLVNGTHITNVEDRVSKGRSAKGIANGRSKLTLAEVESIKLSSDTHASLARYYDVSSKAIRNIRNGVSW